MDQNGVGGLRRVIMRVGVAVGGLRRMRMRVVGRLEVAGLVGTAMDEDIDFGGGQAAALDAMRCQLGVEAEGAGNGFELLQRDAGVYGCAEKHVATDSGETIQEGNTHYESEGRMPEAPI